jgi:GTP-binding protein HflX
VQRAKREKATVPRAAIVGYTNAGKSSLLNALAAASVLAKDQLFATLDPTTRRMSLSKGGSLLLTDTVGFVRNLPHHLVEAFKSTLEEAAEADLLVEVVDASDPEAEIHMAATDNVLREIGAGEVPRVLASTRSTSSRKPPSSTGGGRGAPTRSSARSRRGRAFPNSRRPSRTGSPPPRASLA